MVGDERSWPCGLDPPMAGDVADMDEGVSSLPAFFRAAVSVVK